VVRKSFAILQVKYLSAWAPFPGKPASLYPILVGKQSAVYAIHLASPSLRRCEHEKRNLAIRKALSTYWEKSMAIAPSVEIP
jgi:hypothetical protein